MSSVVRLAPSISLEDEFADFEVREELERELERRLTPDRLLDARPALKSFEPVADDDQLSLIHASGHQLIQVVAPAGSGKTQTVIHRVLQQAKRGTRPERVLCLTFDNAAAKALRDKYFGISSTRHWPRHLSNYDAKFVWQSPIEEV